MQVGHYERRAPEKTLLYQTIQRYFETFVQLFEERSGGALPKYIRREFEDYLACGIPAHGFLRILCSSCQDASILPFSCHRRGFCPSCGARKMADSAAFLSDWVLPDSVAYRQYVLTVPIPLRFWMAKSGKLMGEVYRIFSSEVRAWVESHCEGASDGGPSISSGTLTFIQRFGDGMRYHPHFHLLVSEGGWRESGNQPNCLEFVPTVAPDPQQLCELLERIQIRIVKRLRRLGLIKENESSAETSAHTPSDPDSSASPEQLLLFEMQGCSTQNRFALSTPPGKPVRREARTELGQFGRIGDSARLSTEGSLLAILKGFSLHAGTSAKPTTENELPPLPGDTALERLLRYMARNSTPLERLKPASGGDVLIKLKRHWSDGTTHLRFSGVELIERLSALIPPPRTNLTRFGGCFAPGHRLRPKVVALAPGAKNNPLENTDAVATSSSPTLPPTDATENPAPTAQTKCYSLSWSKLLARVYKEDVTHCRKCGGKIKITDAILERDAIIRILISMHIPTELPKFHPPSRAPPRQYDLQEFELSS